MPRTSLGRDEYLFVQMEESFGKLAYPQSSGFIPHLSSKLRLEEQRENRPERTCTRGLKERIALRRACSFEIEGYLTAKSQGELEGIKTLFYSSGFEWSFDTNQATILENPTPTTKSFAIDPADALLQGDFVVIDNQIRYVLSNEAGIITVLPRLASAPAPQTPVKSTPKLRPHNPPTPLSFSLFRRGSLEAELAFGCVPASISIEFAGGEPVKIKASGSAKDVISWATTYLAEDIDQDQPIFSVLDAQNLEPLALISIGGELMRVISVDCEQNKIAVERGWNGTEQAYHSVGDEILPIWVEPTDLGRLFYGTVGEIFLGDDRLALVDFEFNYNCGSTLFNREFGTSSATRALFDKKREASLRSKALVDSISIAHLMRAKHKKLTHIFICAYGKGCAIALYLPKVEFDIPEISREQDSAVIVELKGVALESEGCDEAFLGILL